MLQVAATWFIKARAIKVRAIKVQEQLFDLPELNAPLIFDQIIEPESPVQGRSFDPAGHHAYARCGEPMAPGIL